MTALVTTGKSARGVSGADGAMSLELPPGATGTLLVEAAGYGMAFAPFRVRSGQTVQAVRLTPAAGSLILSDLPYDVYSEGALTSEQGVRSLYGSSRPSRPGRSPSARASRSRISRPGPTSYAPEGVIAGEERSSPAEARS